MTIEGASLASIILPKKPSTNDTLLTLLLNLCNPQQITVTHANSSSSSKLILHPNTPHAVELTQRNAMVRALCSTIAPLNAFPWSLYGNSDANRAVKAQIHAYMSMASSMTHANFAQVLKGLQDRLECVGFVAGTTQASVADWDLYLSIMTKVKVEDVSQVIKQQNLTNVQRWLEATQVSVQKAAMAVGSSNVVLPEPMKFSKRSLLPSFVYPDLATVSSNASANVNPITSSSGDETKKKANEADSVKNINNNNTGNAPSSGELTDEQKKAAAEKRAKKAAEKAAKKANKAPAATEVAAGSDFTVSALDIRVGKILKAWEHPDADKLYCEEVDVGEDKPRQIASGLRPFYKLDDMQNQTVLVLCNLKPRPLVGFNSHGMVMCASNEDHTQVQFAVPPADAKVGDRVTFEGFAGEPEAENKVAKKKIFEKVAPDLKTDGEGNVVYKGVLGKVAGCNEPCRAKLGMPNAHVA